MPQAKKGRRRRMRWWLVVIKSYPCIQSISRLSSTRTSCTIQIQQPTRRRGGADSFFCIFEISQQTLDNMCMHACHGQKPIQWPHRLPHQFSWFSHSYIVQQHAYVCHNNTIIIITRLEEFQVSVLGVPTNRIGIGSSFAFMDGLYKISNRILRISLSHKWSQNPIRSGNTASRIVMYCIPPTQIF